MKTLALLLGALAFLCALVVLLAGADAAHDHRLDVAERCRRAGL